jgi:hypothetical protein
VSDHDPRLVRESLRHLLTTTDPADRVAGLVETGWPELFVEDAELAVGALFEAQGEATVSSPMLNVLLDSVLRASACQPASPPGHALLPHPGAGGTPPAAFGHATALHVDGCLFGPFDGSQITAVAIADNGELSLVELDAHALSYVEVAGLDPSLRLIRVSGTVARDGQRHLARRVPAQWEGGVATCRLALGHELVAAAETAVALAIEHAGQREQFGQQVGSFQAVQHRLADATVAVHVARLGIEEGWRHQTGHTAAVGKLLAGRAAREVAKQVQQVLGGMGFSWEHPFHHTLRRLLSLDLFLGSCTQLERELGAELLAAEGLPELQPL